MELKEGEYVRSKQGYIAKVTNTSEEIICFDSAIQFYYEEDWTLLGSELDKVKAHSKNIIDLIEEEDIVILEYYVSAYRKRIQRKFEVETLGNDISFLNNRCVFLYDREKQKFIDGEGFNIKIKSIVTKEQFDSIKYEVE